MALRPSLAVNFQALAHLKAGNICVGNSIDFLDLAVRVRYKIKKKEKSSHKADILFHTGAGQ